MKTLTEKELRELDAFIAVHIFGWVPETRSTYAGEHNAKGYGLNKHLHLGDKDRYFQSEYSFPHARYSTDPAYAMQVLEKCIEKDAYAVGAWIRGMKGEFLPTAIALFAKQLYSK